LLSQDVMQNKLQHWHFHVQHELDEGNVTTLHRQQSIFALAQNLVAHGKEHIKTRYNFIQHQVKEKNLKWVYCKTEYHIADIFTKPLKIETPEKIGNDQTS